MPSTSPFFIVTLFFIAGIIIQARWHVPLNWLGAGAVLALLLGWIFSSRRVVSMALICTAFLFIGAVYLEVNRILPADHINRISWAKRKAPIELTGIVASDVQNRPFFRGKKTTFTLEVKRVKPESWRREDRQGKILVNIFRDEPLAYGDLVVLTGKLHRPFEFTNDSHFSYRNYLEQRGVKFILSVGKKGSVEVVESDQGNRLTAFSLAMKRRLIKVLDDHLSPVEAALVTGMILGDRYGIPEHIRELFVETGTAHILAISGFNVGIVAFLIFLFLKMIPISRKVQYVITMVFLVFYAFLVGAQPAVVRATIMAVVFISSFIFERESDTTNSLAFAALILLALNPLNIFDVGFQLSFVSVWSISHFYPKIMEGMSRLPVDLKPKPVQYVAQSLAVSLAAEAGIIGMIAYYFNIITPVTVLANLLIIPLMSAIVALGMGLLIAGLALPAAAFVFAACIKLVLNLTVGIIYLLSRLPGAYFYVQDVSLWLIAAYYALIIIVFYGPKLRVSGLTKGGKYDKLDGI